MFRYIRAASRGLRAGERIGPLDEARMQLRVQPHDLDINLHLTNSRYFDLMDVARLDFVGQLGILRPMARRLWRPVLGSVAVRFRLPVNPFQRFSLHTRLLCWDDKWMFLSHRFMRGADEATLAVAKVIVLGRQGAVPPGDVIALTGNPMESPAVPALVKEWMEAEQELSPSSEVWREANRESIES